MMCGLPKMPFRAEESFLRRERRDLVFPRESSTKIIEMVRCGRNPSFRPPPENSYGSSLSMLFAGTHRVAVQTTTIYPHCAGSTFSHSPSAGRPTHLRLEK